MTQLSPHFSLTEFTQSPTARALGLANQPNPAELERLRATAQGLEKVRALFNLPISVSSAFRGQALNKAVRGVSNSAHCLGYAVDFSVQGVTPFEVCRRITLSDIAYDQLIHEFGRWTHISFDPKLRGQDLSIFNSRQGYRAGILPVPENRSASSRTVM